MPRLKALEAADERGVVAVDGRCRIGRHLTERDQQPMQCGTVALGRAPLRRHRQCHCHGAQRAIDCQRFTQLGVLTELRPQLGIRCASKAVAMNDDSAVTFVNKGDCAASGHTSPATLC